MKAIPFAEWLLRRTTTPEHASAQLGDLLELSQSRGLSPTRATLWFWRTVLATVAYAAVRPTLAFLIAFAASQRITQLWNHGALGNHPDLHSVYTTGALVLVPLTLVPIFSLIRFGWRDTTARSTLFLAFSASISLIYFQNAILRCTLPAALLTILVLARFRSSYRSTVIRSLAQLGSALAINILGLIVFLSTFFLCIVSSKWIGGQDIIFRAMTILSQHPANDILNAFICLLILRASNRLRKPAIPA